MKKLYKYIQTFASLSFNVPQHLGYRGWYQMEKWHIRCRSTFSFTKNTNTNTRKRKQ